MVQIGILLDTSGSMRGLIDQARDQLWQIVNAVAKANKNHHDVVIEVGVFEYGKSSLPRYEGYLQMLTPLTEDLDHVSEVLFGLRTNGGEEYAGKVILEAVNRFVWSSDPEDLKLLIIAGNEPFTQGDVPYPKAIEKARTQDIIVNTIFCGKSEEGIRTQWRDGAIQGGGKYFTINHNHQREVIPTPYDEEILKVGKQLNLTYMEYGSVQKRRAKQANRIAQDSNAKSLSLSSSVERSIMKSNKQYTSAKSDIVDAYIQSEAIVERLPESELPESFKGKSQGEIKAMIEKKRDERKALQKQMKQLEAKRSRFLAQKRSQSDKSLGSAIIESLQTQATKRGFVFVK